MKVIIVEDDPTLNKNIKEILIAEGLNCTAVFDGLIAERYLNKETFDCVILDINLPGKNGFDICRDFRKHNKSTPVLMLTAFGDLDDKIEGFDSGADDYLTKPFFMRELLARVNVLLKRKKDSSHNVKENSIIVFDDIQINTLSKAVVRNDKEIELTPREYQILIRLCQTKGEVVSKAELIKEIWGSSFDANTNTIEVYINFLRNKLDKPFGKNTIKTKVGYGYYLSES